MSNNNNLATIVGCIIILLTPLLVILAWMWGGFALAYAWNLLIAPLGLIELTTVQAMGIGLVAGFITKEVKFDNCDKEPKGVLMDVIVGILRPALLMFFAWGLTWATT